jgi:guanylate kinase
MSRERTSSRNSKRMPPTSSRAPRGHLYVISAPSGAGKTSLVKALLARNPALQVSISHTTRTPRVTEKDGREYHFVSREAFEDLRRRDEFLEHAQVFDNLYGTGRETVERLLAAGTSVVLEIDWQGAQQVRKAMPESVTIFILPPSLAALRERLQKRQTDSPEVIARRFGDAVGDVSHWSEFQYVVVNEDFERAVSDLARIVAGRGEDLRATRPGLDRFVEALLGA